MSGCKTALFQRVFEFCDSKSYKISLIFTFKSIVWWWKHDKNCEIFHLFSFEYFLLFVFLSLHWMKKLLSLEYSIVLFWNKRLNKWFFKSHVLKYNWLDFLMGCLCNFQAGILMIIICHSFVKTSWKILIEEINFHDSQMRKFQFR